MIFAMISATTACLQKPRIRGIGLLAPLVFAQVFVLSLPSANLSAAELPNILWLTCEDTGPNLGSYGDKYATTPDLDLLAARGMSYTHAKTLADFA